MFIHQQTHQKTLTTSPHGFTHIRPTASEKSASFKSWWLNWVIWCEVVLCIRTERNDKQRIWISCKGVCHFRPYRCFQVNSHFSFTAHILHTLKETRSDSIWTEKQIISLNNFIAKYSLHSNSLRFHVCKLHWEWIVHLGENKLSQLLFHHKFLWLEKSWM